MFTKKILQALNPDLDDADLVGGAVLDDCLAADDLLHDTDGITGGVQNDDDPAAEDLLHDADLVALAALDDDDLVAGETLDDDDLVAGQAMDDIDLVTRAVTRRRADNSQLLLLQAGGKPG